jgi:hypothetical protein
VNSLSGADPVRMRRGTFRVTENRKAEERSQEIHVHNVGNNQEQFIHDFCERVIPNLNWTGRSLGEE